MKFIICAFGKRFSKTAVQRRAMLRALQSTTSIKQELSYQNSQCRSIRKRVHNITNDSLHRQSVANDSAYANLPGMILHCQRFRMLGKYFDELEVEFVQVIASLRNAR